MPTIQKLPDGYLSMIRDDARHDDSCSRCGTLIDIGEKVYFKYHSEWAEDFPYCSLECASLSREDDKL